MGDDVRARLGEDERKAGAPDRQPLPLAVEHGVECFHGSPRACSSYRCGSNCSQRFDRMHPCPACLIAEIDDLRTTLAARAAVPDGLARLRSARVAHEWPMETDHGLDHTRCTCGAKPPYSPGGSEDALWLAQHHDEALVAALTVAAAPDGLREAVEGLAAGSHEVSVPMASGAIDERSYDRGAAAMKRAMQAELRAFLAAHPAPGGGA